MEHRAVSLRAPGHDRFRCGNGNLAVRAGQGRCPAAGAAASSRMRIPVQDPGAVASRRRPPKSGTAAEPRLRPPRAGPSVRSARHRAVRSDRRDPAGRKDAVPGGSRAAPPFSRRRRLPISAAGRVRQGGDGEEDGEHGRAGASRCGNVRSADGVLGPVRARLAAACGAPYSLPGSARLGTDSCRPGGPGSAPAGTRRD